jgi:hypothetical protein
VNEAMFPRTRNRRVRHDDGHHFVWVNFFQWVRRLSVNLNDAP